MKREVIDCDRCGQEDIDPIKMSLTVDRIADGAGSMESDVRRVDLCHECAEVFLKAWTNGLSYQTASDVYEAIKSHRKAVK